MKTFEEWMKEVDDWLENIVGVTSKDLPDRLYADMYAEGQDPETCATQIFEDLEAAGIVSFWDIWER